MDARLCAFVDKSKPSAGRFALRIIRKVGTPIDLVASTNQQHCEALAAFQVSTPFPQHLSTLSRSRSRAPLEASGLLSK